MCAAGLCSLVPAWQPLAAVWGIPAHPTWLWDVIAFHTWEAVGEGGCWKAEGQTAQGSAWRGVRCWHSVARDSPGVVLSVLGGQWWSPTPRDGPTPHTPAALGCVSLTCCCGSTQPNTPWALMMVYIAACVSMGSRMLHCSLPSAVPCNLQRH